jgi:hypothetical protein
MTGDRRDAHRDLPDIERRLIYIELVNGGVSRRAEAQEGARPTNPPWVTYPVRE